MIYRDILLAISNQTERSHFRGPKSCDNRTHLALITGLQHDKFNNHIALLTENKLLTTHPFTVTLKGYSFLRECEILDKSQLRLELILNKHTNITFTTMLRSSTSTEHKLTDAQQVINVQNAIIKELEKK